MDRVKASDLAEICGWYELRGLRSPPFAWFPEIGLWERGIAAGFLYRTDSALVLLDAFVSNPSAPLRARHRALYMVAEGLLECAAQAGAAHVSALCRSRGIQKLSLRFGFRRMGTYSMTGRAV